MLAACVTIKLPITREKIYSLLDSLFLVSFVQKMLHHILKGHKKRNYYMLMLAGHPLFPYSPISPFIVSWCLAQGSLRGAQLR